MPKTSKNKVTETIEKFFEKSPRLFKSKAELVKALGCEIVAKSSKDRVDPKTRVGHAPDPDAAHLLKDRKIYCQNGKIGPFAVHEAVHAFTNIIEDEGLFMAFEVYVYSMLKSAKDRYEMFDFFSQSLSFDKDFRLEEIYSIIKEENYSFESVWAGLLYSADNKFITKKETIRKSLINKMIKNLRK